MSPLVRLVRACGSKRTNVKTKLHTFMVRLVRACGSKLQSSAEYTLEDYGQARKSLWIETFLSVLTLDIPKVRLVRACGSKPASLF